MSDLDFEKYKNDGWGLSVDGFKELYEIISNHPKKELQVLEFGSGTSTRFLVDVATTITTKTINIESYDNSEYWCYKPDRHYDFFRFKN